MSTLKLSLSTLAPVALLALVGHSQTANAGPRLIDSTFGDKAVDCLAGTHVSYFNTSRSVVAPFNSTRLSWSVDVPSGCAVHFKVAGVSVPATGSLNVTPIHASNTYSLNASMTGFSGAIADVHVNVSQSTCHMEPVAEQLLAPRISAVIAEVDDADSDFYQVASPDIWLDDDGLFITLHIKGALWWWPDPTINLELGLDFYARNGAVHGQWVRFMPKIGSSLPDADVSQAIFDKAAGILAAFEWGFNSALDAPPIVEDGEQIFDVTPAFGELQVTVCPKPRMVWYPVFRF